ncbi:MAG TPA: minor capsid protein [Clostridia bacterium]|nr:minor capsid protein [Clostridia bacterium]
MSRGIASADEVLSQLERVYAKAAREIQGEVRRLYERYGDEYGLSYADAIKDIEQSAYKEWRMTLADYVERINATGDVELLRELNTLSTRARVTRLQTLEAAVKVNASELAAKGETLVTQLLSDTYTGTYYRAAYDFQRGTGFGSSLEMLAPEQVAKAISYPWSGADYSARIWKNADALTSTLNETITQGLIQGKDIRQMTAGIQDATGAGLYNAQRLVRTEAAYAVESAELRSYADSGVEQYEVFVSLDERTCKKCGARDGEVHATADAKTSVNYPPFHSNCRCTTVAHFSEEQLEEWEKLGHEYTGAQDEPSKRFARAVDGKGVMLPSNLTYDAWFDQYVNGDPEYLVKYKAHQNRAADKLLYEKYRVVSSEIPETFALFQKMKYNNTEQWGRIKSGFLEDLSKKSYAQLSMLNGKLGNKEVRVWYKAQDEGILGRINENMLIESQARQAHSLRNQYRQQARDLMKDRKLAEELDRDHPNLPFEDYLKKYMARGMSRDDACKEIIQSSTRTNKDADRAAGLEG